MLIPRALVLPQHDVLVPEFQPDLVDEREPLRGRHVLDADVHRLAHVVRVPRVMIDREPVMLAVAPRADPALVAARLVDEVNDLAGPHHVGHEVREIDAVLQSHRRPGYGQRVMRYEYQGSGIAPENDLIIPCPFDQTRRRPSRARPRWRRWRSDGTGSWRLRSSAPSPSPPRRPGRCWRRSARAARR